MKSVYSAVRTGSLNTAVCASSLMGNNTKIAIKIVLLFPHMFGLIADRVDSRESVFRFLCKARQIYAGSCASVHGFMSREILMIIRVKIRSPPVSRTIFYVILRDAIKIPIYNTFRFLIIAKHSQYFVKGLNVEKFSRGRQTKTLAEARKPMQTQGRT